MPAAATLRRQHSAAARQPVVCLLLRPGPLAVLALCRSPQRLLILVQLLLLPLPRLAARLPRCTAARRPRRASASGPVLLALGSQLQALLDLCAARARGRGARTNVEVLFC